MTIPPKKTFSDRLKTIGTGVSMLPSFLIGLLIIFIICVVSYSAYAFHASCGDKGIGACILSKINPFDKDKRVGCAPDEQKIGKRCFQACPSGYDPRKKKCLQVCPTGFENRPNKCMKISVAFGDGFPSKNGDLLTARIKRCEQANGVGNCEKVGLRVLKKCPSGYTRKGGECRAACPQGFENRPRKCIKPIADSGKKFASKNKCEKKHGSRKCEKVGLVFRKKCSSGYSRSSGECRKNCPSGMKNKPLACLKKTVEFGKGFPTQKGDGLLVRLQRCEDKHGVGNCEQVNLRVLKKCPAGYERKSNKCRIKCPSGMEDKPLACMKTKIERPNIALHYCPEGRARDGNKCKNV